MNNWLILQPMKRHMYLQIGYNECHMHTKQDIYAAKQPDTQGWDGYKLKLVLQDDKAKHILFEWMQNGPFDMSDPERSLLRLPDDIREMIESFQQLIQKQAS